MYYKSISSLIQGCVSASNYAWYILKLPELHLNLNQGYKSWMF